MLKINSPGHLFLASASLALLLCSGSVAQPLLQSGTGSDDNVLSIDAAGASTIESAGNTRITTVREEVIIRQGLIEIIGDTARLEQDLETGDLIRVTVEGQPARFSRAGENGVEAITGHSASIIYYNETQADAVMSVVEFLGDAHFNRGRTSFQCSRVKHTIESGATDSPGPCSAILAPAAAAAAAEDTETTPN